MAAVQAHHLGQHGKEKIPGWENHMKHCPKIISSSENIFVVGCCGPKLTWSEGKCLALWHSHPPVLAVGLPGWAKRGHRCWGLAAVSGQWTLESQSERGPGGGVMDEMNLQHNAAPTIIKSLFHAPHQSILPSHHHPTSPSPSSPPSPLASARHARTPDTDRPTTSPRFPPPQHRNQPPTILITPSWRPVVGRVDGRLSPERDGVQSRPSRWRTEEEDTGPTSP